MSKWKCEICNSEFDNFQAQGFNHKIYCPLCYFKELNIRKDKEIERLNNIINELEKCIKEKYNEVHNYQTKIRQSDLQQGDYPVSYYYAERDEKMSIYYLDKLKELKESGNNE